MPVVRTAAPGVARTFSGLSPLSAVPFAPILPIHAALTEL
jgi:hypothetical protein